MEGLPDILSKLTQLLKLQLGSDWMEQGGFRF